MIRLDRGVVGERRGRACRSRRLTCRASAALRRRTRGGRRPSTRRPARRPGHSAHADTRAHRAFRIPAPLRPGSRRRDRPVRTAKSFCAGQRLRRWSAARGACRSREASARYRWPRAGAPSQCPCGGCKRRQCTPRAPRLRCRDRPGPASPLRAARLRVEGDLRDADRDRPRTISTLSGLPREPLPHRAAPVDRHAQRMRHASCRSRNRCRRGWCRRDRGAARVGSFNRERHLCDLAVDGDAERVLARSQRRFVDA